MLKETPLQSLRDLMTGPRASQSFDGPQAREHLAAEAQRLRSGAGGYGGRSPEALSLADAIDRVLTAADIPEGSSHEAGKRLAVEAQRLRSGAGGHGGRGPKALSLADAIDRVLTATSPDHAI